MVPLTASNAVIAGNACLAESATEIKALAKLRANLTMV